MRLRNTSRPTPWKRVTNNPPKANTLNGAAAEAQILQQPRSFLGATGFGPVTPYWMGTVGSDSAVHWQKADAKGSHQPDRWFFPFLRSLLHPSGVHRMGVYGCTRINGGPGPALLPWGIIVRSRKGIYGLHPINEINRIPDNIDHGFQGFICHRRFIQCKPAVHPLKSRQSSRSFSCGPLAAFVLPGIHYRGIEVDERPPAG